MDMEGYDIVAAAVINDEAVVIVSETDAAEAHSHSSSSSSSSSADEADFGEEECGERSSWLSSSSTSMQRLRQHHNGDESSNDNSSDDDDDDDGNDSEIIKGETAAAGSYKDDLYCENMDDEDEAWVYQHMRSGGVGGGGREILINAHRPHHLQNGVDSSTEQYENLHHSKKRRGIDNKTSQARDTDDIGSAASESESKNPTETNNDQQQHHQESFMPSPLMQQQHHHQQQQQAPPSSTMTLVKPRSSDAILSCPSCLNILCMDCQQHEKYANQYRAMFVMNIGVDWNRKMVYDDAVGSLKLVAGDSTSGACDNADAIIARYALSGNRMGEEDLVENDLHMQHGEGVDPERANSHLPDKVPEEQHDASASSSNHDTKENENDESESFYSVHCSYCRYEVAALDMKDEIYYFFGCIASA